MNDNGLTVSMDDREMPTIDPVASRSEYARNYRKNNRKRVLAAKLKYRQENPEKISEYAKLHHKNNPDARRAYVYRSTYGITLDDYNMMFAEQGGVCSICKKAETSPHNITKKTKRLAIDHNHETGQVRGLLCYRCNIFLGKYEALRDLIPEFESYLQAVGVYQYDIY